MLLVATKSHHDLVLCNSKPLHHITHLLDVVVVVEVEVVVVVVLPVLISSGSSDGMITA